MPQPFDFYFDFSSPYGYLASVQIEDLAASLGRRVNWHPILLGPMFKETGALPPVNVPLKADYAEKDFARSAALFDIPYRHPKEFPINTIAAARVAHCLTQEDMALAAKFCKQTYAAFFADNQDIRDLEVLRSQLQSVGADAEAVLNQIQTDEVKQALKLAINDAMSRGVFGSPFVFFDDEPFWGFDRLPHIRLWAQQQGKVT